MPEKSYFQNLTDTGNFFLCAFYPNFENFALCRSNNFNQFTNF